MSVVRRVAKRFGSSLLERYWPEIEHLSDGLGSAVSFKIPAFRYVADLKELFALARRWVITSGCSPWIQTGLGSESEKTSFTAPLAPPLSDRALNSPGSTTMSPRG